jgi:hypothetical protein
MASKNAVGHLSTYPQYGINDAKVNPIVRRRMYNVFFF